MKDLEVVVVSVKEIEEVAEENGYGKIKCPWDKDAFDECGAFDVYREEIEDQLQSQPNAWNLSCLKIMDEEKENHIMVIGE